jgi:hypothetical protein
MQIRVSRALSMAVSAGALAAALAVGYTSGVRAQQDQPPLDDAMREWLRRQNMLPLDGVVLSGNDLGFRIERQRWGVPLVMGKLVVRINGEWVDARIPDFAMAPVREAAIR